MRINPRELRHTLQFCYGVYHTSTEYPNSNHPQFGYLNLKWSLLAVDTAKVAIPFYLRHVLWKTIQVNVQAMGMVWYLYEHVVLHVPVCGHA